MSLPQMRSTPSVHHPDGDRNMYECSADDIYFTIRYYPYAIAVAITTIFQMFLALHSVFNEISLRNDQKYRAALKLRILYITQQLLATYWLICDILRKVIDPHSHIVQKTPWCKWIGM